MWGWTVVQNYIGLHVTSQLDHVKIRHETKKNENENGNGNLNEKKNENGKAEGSLFSTYLTLSQISAFKV